jgi:hypothetical protein
VFVATHVPLDVAAGVIVLLIHSVVSAGRWRAVLCVELCLKQDPLMQGALMIAEPSFVAVLLRSLVAELKECVRQGISVSKGDLPKPSVRRGSFVSVSVFVCICESNCVCVCVYVSPCPFVRLLPWFSVYLRFSASLPSVSASLCCFVYICASSTCHCPASLCVSPAVVCLSTHALGSVLPCVCAEKQAGEPVHEASRDR